MLKLEKTRPKFPENYDRYIVKGAGYLAKLEMDYDKLKAAFKNLSQERAQWLITKEENLDLHNQVVLLEKWRQRALIAENKLLEKQTLSMSFVSDDSKRVMMDNEAGNALVIPKLEHSSVLSRLERENEILLSDYGQLSAKYGCY